jgi:hypothetical protein
MPITFESLEHSMPITFESLEHSTHASTNVEGDSWEQSHPSPQTNQMDLIAQRLKRSLY